MGISLSEGISCPTLQVTGTVGGDEGDSWTSDGLWEVGYGSDSDHAPSISPCQHDQTCSDTEQETVAACEGTGWIAVHTTCSRANLRQHVHPSTPTHPHTAAAT